MGALFQATGIVGGLLCSWYLTNAVKGHTQERVNLPPYKGTLLLIGALTLITGVMVYLAMIYKHTLALYITIGLNGLANLSTYAIMYELAVEVTYL